MRNFDWLTFCQFEHRSVVHNVAKEDMLHKSVLPSCVKYFSHVQYRSGRRSPVLLWFLCSVSWYKQNTPPTRFLIFNSSPPTPTPPCKEAVRSTVALWHTIPLCSPDAKWSSHHPPCRHPPNFTHPSYANSSLCICPSLPMTEAADSQSD